MFEEQYMLISLATIFVLGIGAQWLAWKLRLPSILLLLIFGFVAGMSGLVNPDALLGDLLLPLVSLSVAVILFEGGLSLRLPELKESGRVIWTMVSLGALVTWALSSLAAYYLLDFTVSTALLVGAILVVTGPTVIGPLLRHIHPVGRVGAIAKWEGIIIDPIGAVLAVFVYEASKAANEAIEVAGRFQAAQQAALAVGTALMQTVIIGVTIGTIMALVTILLLRKFWIPDFLQSPVLLMVVVAAFTASNLFQEESGLFTVTLMGVILANQKVVSVRHLIEFKENLRVLLISMLFIILAARLEMRELQSLSWNSVWFVLALVLVVRPVAVFISGMFSGLKWREMLFLSWLAPRGIVAAAVASVFALKMNDTQGLVPVTFLVIIATVAIYGLTAPAMAQKLKMAKPNPQGVLIVGSHSLARQLAKVLQSINYPVLLVDDIWANISQARIEGISAQYASILSEHALNEMDLSGIGRLLALTPNDEVNSLAALHFSEAFGRSEVYQLPPVREQDNHHTKRMSFNLRGRLLFGNEATYAFLNQRLNEGAVIKKTNLTKEFDYEAFLERYSEEALVMFTVKENGELVVRTQDSEVTPKPGQTLIALVDEKEEKAEEKKKKKERKGKAS